MSISHHKQGHSPLISAPCKQINSDQVMLNEVEWSDISPKGAADAALFHIYSYPCHTCSINKLDQALALIFCCTQARVYFT